jgi:uncharacterized membrane protein
MLCFLFSLSTSCVLCAQCYKFLRTVYSWLTLRFPCLRLVSCVPSVTSFSGLSILDWPFGFFVYVLCLVCPVLQVSQDCLFLIDPSVSLSTSCVLCAQCYKFLWTVYSWLTLRFLCLRLVSFVPSVTSFSGLSILDWPFGFFVYVLCLVCPVLQVSLDCLLLIDPSVSFGFSSWKQLLEKPKGQSRIDSPEKLVTLGTQDTRRRQRNRRVNQE